MSEYTIKDTGDRTRYATGAVRDARVGKGYFHQLSWPALQRLAVLTEYGARKYPDAEPGLPNYQRGMPISSPINSAIRHLGKYLAGLKDEDHLVAALWNLMAAVHTETLARADLNGEYGTAALPAWLLDAGPYRSGIPEPPAEDEAAQAAFFQRAEKAWAEHAKAFAERAEVQAAFREAATGQAIDPGPTVVAEGEGTWDGLWTRTQEGTVGPLPTSPDEVCPDPEATSPAVDAQTGSPSDRERGFMYTRSGVKVFFDRPEENDYRIDDIAYHLAHTNRYAGAVGAYSVAEHSIRMSYIVPPEDALEALMHDAAEAYVHDIGRGVKRQPELAGYRALEARVDAALRHAYDLKPEAPESVHKADRRMAATEMRDLMPDRPDEPIDAEPLPDRIEPWSAETAFLEFLRRYAELQYRRKHPTFRLHFDGHTQPIQDPHPFQGGPSAMDYALWDKAQEAGPVS